MWTWRIVKTVTNNGRKIQKVVPNEKWFYIMLTKHKDNASKYTEEQIRLMKLHHGRVRNREKDQQRKAARIGACERIKIIYRGITTGEKMSSTRVVNNNIRKAAEAIKRKEKQADTTKSK